ncbi:MAG: HAMP domain-containing histidine kinase [Phycisphaerales bacterium]|nr:HAMP domain-containing histidine kinase [Phycisphaerales bacterium]
MTLVQSNASASELTSVLSDRDAVPWPRRVDLAHWLRDHIDGPSPAPDALAAVSILASDPKPEVRHAVAGLLEIVPEPLFDTLRSNLGSDENAFVRQRASKAIEKRRTAARTRARAIAGADQIAAELDAIENRYGRPAAQEAWRLCRRFNEQLVGAMVHDLRNIVTHLKSNVASLISAAGAPQGRRVGDIQDGLNHLERTIRDMEQFTEPLDLAFKKLPLCSLVAKAMDQAKASVRRLNGIDPNLVAVDMEIADRIFVEAAEHQLVAAFANVLKNAFEAFMFRDAGDPPSQIEIRAAEGSDCVSVIVRDNGMGFSEEEGRMLYLHTPGRRNKNKRNSTGYGLPNAMRKIEAHGGTLTIESEEGAGTTVMIRLPSAMAGRAT